MWQSLYEELHHLGFTVITVALDTGGADASRAFIERAKPAHPSLIDRRHAVADLYQFVNVPNAVWIDEQGTIVRTAHAPAATAAMASMIGLGADDYLNAVRDWVAHGSASRFVPSSDQRRASQHTPDGADVIAALNFRLGEYLVEHAHAGAARQYLEEAVRLRPGSWAYRRQVWALFEPPEKNGTLWYAATVQHPVLPDEPYYAPVHLEGDAAPIDPAEAARKQRQLFESTFGRAFAKKDDASA